MSDERSASEQIAEAATRVSKSVRVGYDPSDDSKRAFNRLCRWTDADDLLFSLIGSSPFVDTLTARSELLKTGQLDAANAITEAIELVQSMHDEWQRRKGRS